MLAFVSSTALIVLLHARAGELAPGARRAAVLSIYATFLDLGSALGPIVGLSVGTLDALRWALAVGAVLLVLIAFVYRWVAARERADARTPNDLPLDRRSLD